MSLYLEYVLPPQGNNLKKKKKKNGISFIINPIHRCFNKKKKNTNDEDYH